MHAQTLRALGESEMIKKLGRACKEKRKMPSIVLT
jgi:hypothetical protein